MICSVCKKEIKNGDFFAKCSKCSAIAHSACWVKNSGCATSSCSGSPSRQFRCSSDRDIQKLDTGSSRYNPKNIRLNKCPVCHKIRLNGEDTEQCHICQSIYHKECWDQKGGCILKCGENLAVTPKSDRNCPFCMMSIFPDENVTVCPKCGIPHHSDCWEENGGCTTYGCGCKTEDLHSPSNEIIPHTDNKTCPYCQSLITNNERTVYCEICGIPHHENCWQENGGCTTYGCRGHQGSDFSASNNSDQELPPITQPPPPPQQQSCFGISCKSCLTAILFYLILNFLLKGCF